ncbi:MAG TPA: hypothetical protein PKW49_09960 [Paludibacteraceae bacterium]|nr:hypothetical protein [Paludibacteraceae bacterium]
MVENNASEIAAKLTAAIEDIRKNITTLNMDTLELGKQINKQSVSFAEQEKITVELSNKVNEFCNKYSKHTEEIQNSFNSIVKTLTERVNGFFEAYSKQTDEIYASFNQIADKQKTILDEINSWLDQSKETISNVYKHIEATEQDISKAFTDSTKQVLLYQEDALKQFDKLNEHFSELLKKVDALLTHIDESIKVKLEAAAETISKSLQPTLQSLIIAMKNSREALDKTRKRMWISNLILSCIIIIVTIIGLVF